MNTAANIPVHTDVSEFLWPFVHQVIETGGTFLEGSVPWPFLYFLMLDWQRIQPVVRQEVLWPRGKIGASGSAYDPYYVFDTGLYVFPNVHTMFESMHDMYEDAARGEPFRTCSSYIDYNNAMKRFYESMAPQRDDEDQDATDRTSTMLSRTSKRLFARATSAAVNSTEPPPLTLSATITPESGGL